MRCIKCSGPTRVHKVFNVIRLRICRLCGARFKTEEKLLREIKR